MERIYAWIDINGIYYPEYESAYPDNHAGRSPLLETVDSPEAKQEIIAILKTGMNRLIETPRADMPGFTPCPEHLEKLRLFGQNRDKQFKILAAIQNGDKVYDQD